MEQSDSGEVCMLYRTFKVSVERDKGLRMGVSFVTVAVYICAGEVVGEMSLVSGLGVAFVVVEEEGRGGASSFAGTAGAVKDRCRWLR